jgi:peptidoglycan/xylan/chitin deacetylase (PgdA/CDA1 family)
MNHLLRRLRVDARGLRLALGLVASALIVAGCATPPPAPVAEAPQAPAPAPRGPLLGKDRDFAIVVAQSGDDFSVLAERYIGDAKKGWWIAEWNGIDKVTPGQDVVIPLRARNAVGVYPTGFQTIPILCYHRFGANRSAMTVTPSNFEVQMDYLAKNGYHVISMAQLTGFLEGKEPLPKKAVVITIDDGYRSTYQVAYPVLKKYNFPATVYLYSDFVGASDALTWPQMQEMVKSGLIEIQPHSKTHANLTLRLAGENDARYVERMKREVDAPIAVIKERLSLNTLSYAYPYGDVNDVVADLLTRQNVRMGVTVTAGGNGFFSYPFMLRRTMIFGNEDIESFKSKLAVFAKTANR